jgi:anti-sigma regulatory factor (Ser/Thr protein kinase)
LEKVAHESNRAADLVGNFISFARHQSTARQWVNMNDLVNQSLATHQTDIQSAGVELELSLDPMLPDTLVDSDQVVQVLNNLVNNALYAMANHAVPGRLTLLTRRHGTSLRIVVQDNGPGVPEDLVERIFEPFFTTKPVGSGIGLGLSIGHSVLSDHGGQFGYENAPEGGARFIMEFPLLETEQQVIEEEPPAADPDRIASPEAPSAQVLVLDDEKSVAELLGEILETLGHRATIACSGEEALELLSQTDFDVILSDFRMPNMNGREFYESAVWRRPELAPRIIFLTGDVINR